MDFYKRGILYILVIFLSATSLAASAFYQFHRIGTYEQPPIATKEVSLPSSAFTFPQPADQEVYPSLRLEYAPIQLNVPNLQPFLSFHGKNLREDAPKNPPELFFSLTPSKEGVPFKSGEKVFLVHENGIYSFSPQNRPSSLWFVPSLKGADAQLKVTVQNEDGTLSDQPKSNSELLMKEKPLFLPQPMWNIGPFRADQTLLMRQGAKWAGKDLFLEKHGGDEYKDALGKERVSFKSDDGFYDLYVESGDVFIFSDGRWRSLKKGENSRLQPLLKAARIDDKVMALELFSSSGAQRILYSLIKQPDAIAAVNLQSDFTYVGARTKVHSLFKVSGKREIVGVGDWFIRSGEGWTKMKSSKEIDRYLGGSLEGPLLVIDAIEEQGGDRGFKATLFSEKRAHSQDVFLPFATAATPPKPQEQVEQVEPEESLKD